MLRRAIFTFLFAGTVLIAGPRALVTGVDSIGLTVSDLDRSVEFYSKALQFRKVSEVEFDGDAYEHLSGVFGMRARIARMTLGGESIELTEYVAPRGLPMPVDSRSNDRWFQHVAIIVSDMDRAYARRQAVGVVHVSPSPQRLPDWNPNAGGIRAFYFKDPDGTCWRSSGFQWAKARRNGDARTRSFSVSIIRRSLSVTRLAAYGATATRLALWSPERAKTGGLSRSD